MSRKKHPKPKLIVETRPSKGDSRGRSSGPPQPFPPLSEGIPTRARVIDDPVNSPVAVTSRQAWRDALARTLAQADDALDGVTWTTPYTVSLPGVDSTGYATFRYNSTTAVGGASDGT